jgi:hypothetical protein
MRKLFFISLVTIIIEGCVAWNENVFNNEKRFMNTGTAVEIHNDTLVIGTSFISNRDGGYLTIYERKNGKWDHINTFDANDLVAGYKLPINRKGLRGFISASDTVIAAGARRANITGGGYQDKAIIVLEKQNGTWNFVDTIWGRDYATDLLVGSGFASSISVEKNIVMVMVEGSDTYFDITGGGNIYVQELGRYLYTDVKSGIYFYVVKNGRLIEKINMPFPITVGPFNGGIGKILDDRMLITTNIYKDVNGENIQAGQGRISIFQKKEGAWELINQLDDKNIPDVDWNYSLRFTGMTDKEIYTASSGNVYILREEDNLWKIKQKILIPGSLGRVLESVVLDNNILALAHGGQIYIYRDNGSKYVLTDTVNLNEFSKKSIFSVVLSISQDTLVVGVNNVDVSYEMSDTIAFVPYLPFLFSKNPGAVYIMKILPHKGYEMVDIIVRDYALDGKVYFKNKLH